MGLQGALPWILALRVILGEKTVESLLGIVQGQGQGKPEEGLYKVFPVDNLSPSPWEVTRPPFKNLTFLKGKTPHLMAHLSI